jgi:hypothetical protein
MFHTIDMQMIKRNQVNNNKIKLARKLFLSAISLLLVFLSFSQKNNNTSFKEEYAIFKIYLQDDKSTEGILGKNIWKKHFEANEMFPRIECISNNNRQILRLFFHYGGLQNSVAEFELLYMPQSYKKDRNVVKIDKSTFISKNGVELGMSKLSVINLIGKNYKVKNTKKYEELLYYTEDTTSGILKKIGGVAYFIKCRFVNGKLNQYNFGFEYP